MFFSNILFSYTFERLAIEIEITRCLLFLPINLSFIQHTRISIVLVDAYINVNIEHT